MDVAAVGGNYEIMKADASTCQECSMIQSNKKVWTNWSHDPNAVVQPGPHEPWRPGRYRLTLKLREQDPVFGPPIGWKLYNQPLSAEVEVVVANQVVESSSLDSGKGQ